MLSGAGDPVRTGAAYESEREGSLAQLSSRAERRRVTLGRDLVLVFETPDTARAALEELLRAERGVDDDRIALERAAVDAMVDHPDSLTATLFVDLADPVALADRLTDLTDIATAVSLEVAGTRVGARAETDGDPAGAYHLSFDLDHGVRTALLAGAEMTVVVDHPACRTSVVLSAESAGALLSHLRA